MSESAPVHATLAAYFAYGGWRGVLLRGPSGVGKSDLASRLMARGWRLVADDRVVLWRSGDRVWGRAPDVLKNLLEVRGVGVLSIPTLGFCEITSVIDCVGLSEEVERIPAVAAATLCGLDLPLCRIAAAAPSAPETVAAFCDALRL